MDDAGGASRTAGSGSRPGRWWGRVWARRVSWRGFLRRQRVATVIVWVALVVPVSVVLGAQGPLVRLAVLTEFLVRPWPAACFLAALAVAVLCVGTGTSPLPRRRYWRVVLLAAVGLPAVLSFLTYVGRGVLSTLLLVELGVAILVLAVGVARRRMGWGMLGFAVLYATLAALIAIVVVSGVRRPPVGSAGWLIGLATHQLSYALGYLVFLVVTLTAPIGLLTGAADRHRRVRGWLDSTRSRGALMLGCGLAGTGLLAWLLVVYRDRSPWLWCVAVVAALLVLAAVRWTARRPLTDAGERLAGWWVAGAVTLPYAVLLPVLLGGSPVVVYRWASLANRWTWALLLIGVVVLWWRRGRSSTGTALLLLVTVMALLHRFVHVVVDTKATACLLVLVVAGWELAIRAGWLAPDRDGPGTRARLAVVKAALLALLVVGVLGLVPDGVATQLLFGYGIVVGFVGSLLIDQPGRQLPIPLRGAAYVRAAGWSLAVVSAQGLMLAVNGLAIANGSQGQAADLLVLPLLVVYAGFRRNPEVIGGSAVDPPDRRRRPDVDHTAITRSGSAVVPEGRISGG